MRSQLACQAGEVSAPLLGAHHSREGRWAARRRLAVQWEADGRRPVWGQRRRCWAPDASQLAGSVVGRRVHPQSALPAQQRVLATQPASLRRQQPLQPSVLACSIHPVRQNDAEGRGSSERERPAHELHVARSGPPQRLARLPGSPGGHYGGVSACSCRCAARGAARGGARGARARGACMALPGVPALPPMLMCVLNCTGEALGLGAPATTAATRRCAAPPCCRPRQCLHLAPWRPGSVSSSHVRALHSEREGRAVSCPDQHTARSLRSVRRRRSTTPATAACARRRHSGQPRPSAMLPTPSTLVSVSGSTHACGRSSQLPAGRAGASSTATQLASPRGQQRWARRCLALRAPPWRCTPPPPLTLDARAPPARPCAA